jgi:hypothetical protein
MKSKIVSILAVSLMTLFLSAQAFACGANMGNKTDKDTSASMSDMSKSDQGLSIDRDTGDLNQSGYDTRQDVPETDQSGPSSSED